MNPFVALVVNLLGPLDGKKTFVGSAALGVAMALYLFVPAMAPLAGVLASIGVALVPAGLAHKMQKLIDALGTPEPPEPPPA